METYEFTAPQAVVLRSLANRMRIVSMLFLAIGLALIVSLFPNAGGENRLVVLVVSGLFALLNIVKGVVFIRPTDNLAKIATTQGRDVAELMTAFKELTSGFYWMVIINVVLIVMLVAGVIVGVLGG